MDTTNLSDCEQKNPSLYCFMRSSTHKLYAFSQDFICKSSNIDIALTDPVLQKKYGKQWIKLYAYTFLPALILILIIWLTSEKIFYTFYILGVYFLIIMFPFSYYYIKTRHKLRTLCTYETKIFGQALTNKSPHIDDQYLFF